jgi:hypothetical protein
MLTHLAASIPELHSICQNIVADLAVLRFHLESLSTQRTERRDVVVISPALCLEVLSLNLCSGTGYSDRYFVV